MDLHRDPIEQFREMHAVALKREPFDATAMTLATVDHRGRPSARVVLLKGADARGFVFFTNYESRKAKELDLVKFATLVFHFPSLEQQARIEGAALRVSSEESDAYFASRARGSQLGAWASKQSAELGSREELEARLAKIEERFREKAVTRPPFWGGFRVVPDRIELWQGRKDRLHDRYVFERSDASSPWTSKRLYP